ncbi:DUF1569 domain-containing protein [Paludisphaera rhizosphaerae]|uniref:DUF1569 domain-containing protein n=1 Tax=Paludisphaera rhizosphaerae TaxID=2711216 RepID=UPI0013EC4E16|nr:DUF1569 domain-containing protein [Paludisphaera rhizosphaerae]
MTSGRRSLQFRNFDEINDEVARLLEGCSTVGSWTLGQICNHLATVTRRILNAPVNGPHDTSLRVSEEQRDRVLSTGVLPEGISLPGGLAPPEDMDAREAARFLRQTLADFAAAPGPFAPHRLFGTLSRDQWNRLVCVHCAHHLSFAIPTIDEAS